MDARLKDTRTKDTRTKLQAWWSHRQGLDGSLAGHDAAAVLARTGWARSVGGAAPYLTLFARAGLGREQVDAALAAISIHELPSARACTYVVPAADYALALSVGQAFSDGDMKVARKLGVTDPEVDTLSAAVLKALADGPLDPDALRSRVGTAARNLGPEGTKKGVTTTLPLALGKLQSSGSIRRIPVNGRLDQQRYRYAAWSPNPLAKWKKSAAESYTELGRKYFAWIGPARLAEFQWFSGVGANAARAALEPLNLAAVEGDRFLLPEDLDAFRSFQAPRKPQYALVSSLDGINQLRREMDTLLSPEDRDRELVTNRGAAIADFPAHAILDRGRLVGLWEFDPATESIAWTAFIPRDRALEEAVKKTEAFVREDLGDARSFSLDSPKSRLPRIEALRKAAVA